MKLLMLDIETSPNVAHVWDLWNQNIGLNQLMASGYVLCWSAKWVGEKEVFFSSLDEAKSAKKMLQPIYDLMSEADAIITWNGSQFDVPTLNREFLEHGFMPPAPFAQIDLLQVARRRFKFASNKLEYVVKKLGLGEKVKNEGHSLWVKCMAGVPKALKKMKRYNINDTLILEGVYKKLLPWITDHPHVGLYEGDLECCPNCGSKKLQARGWAFTKLSKYRRFQCQKCGTWARGAIRTEGAKNRPVAS